MCAVIVGKVDVTTPRKAKNRTVTTARGRRHDADGAPFWFSSSSSSPFSSWCWCWCTRPSSPTVSSSSAAATSCRWASLPSASPTRRIPPILAASPSTAPINGGNTSPTTMMIWAPMRHHQKTETGPTGHQDSESKWLHRLLQPRLEPQPQPRPQPGYRALPGDGGPSRTMKPITITSRTSLPQFIETMETLVAQSNWQLCLPVRCQCWLSEIFLRRVASMNIILYYVLDRPLIGSRWYWFLCRTYVSQWGNMWSSSIHHWLHLKEDKISTWYSIHE